MTIRKGGEWGEPGRLARGSVVATSDRQLAELIGGFLASDEVPPPIGLSGGDLHASIGSPSPDRMWTDDARVLPIDVIEIRLDDDDPVLCVAHLVAGRPLRWLTETLVVMNATSLGGQNLGPKAHPGDGLIDVTHGRVPLGDWFTARRRAGAGAHLPHPGLRTSRVSELDLVLGHRLTVRIDGVARGRASRVRCRVLVDFAAIVA